jgi:DNA-binding CsgD family transcriptional regulator
MVPDSIEVSAELLASIFDMQLGIDTEVDWLTRLAKLSGATDAYCVSWTAQDPSSAKFLATDVNHVITPEGVNTIDQILSLSKDASSALLEDLAGEDRKQNALLSKLLNDPSLLIGTMYLQPVRTLLILRYGDKQQGWPDKSRIHFKTILPALLKGHEAHALQVSLRNSLSVCNQILDSSPRGIIALTPNAKIIRANNMANDIIKNSHCITYKDDKLAFSDSTINSQFSALLKEISTLASDSLHELRWNKGFHSQQDKCSIQLSVSAGMVEGWSIETGDSDRFASIFIKQLNAIPMPTAKEVQEFYSLTKSQARLIAALLEDSSLSVAAQKLNLSIHTVRSHLQAIYKKLGVNNNSELIRMISTTIVSYKPSH